MDNQIVRQMDEYIALVRSVVQYPLLERHIKSGLSILKLSTGLWTVLESGEPVVIVRLRDSTLAEMICEEAMAILEEDGDELPEKDD